MRALIRERDGYREANKSLVGVGAHDDPGTSAYRERNTSSTAIAVPLPPLGKALGESHGYLGTDRRGRRSLQVRAMRHLVRERDGYLSFWAVGKPRPP